MKYISNIKLYLLLLLSSFAIISCEQEDYLKPSETPINLTTFVSVGNSLTAGYMDGALYQEGQQNSYPLMLSEIFKTENPSLVFKTPFVGNENGSLLGLESIFQNRFIIDGGNIVRKAGAGTNWTANVYATQGPFHNLGVPGAKSFHLLAPGYGNAAGVPLRTANPHYVRFASSSTSTFLGDVMKLNPTFFTLWIGNNDVLLYALNGAFVNGVDKTDVITPVSTFNTALGTIVATMTKDGAKGVIANIPEITSIPYFTTVTKNDIMLDAPSATALNNGFATYNATLQTLAAGGQISQAEADRRTITFAVGANNPVILDEQLTNLTGINPALLSMRQLEEGELILLTGAEQLKLGKGTQNGPLTDEFILTKIEIAEISNATMAYNSIIRNLAIQYDLAFFDANALMKKLKTEGITYGVTTFNANFVTKGGDAFSLDGVHPNGKGYGIIANGFIQAINSKFAKAFAMVDPNLFKGNF